jgi:hypothetical protein
MKHGLSQLANYGNTTAIYLYQDGVLNNSNHALHIYSNGIQVNDSRLLFVHSDNASSTSRVVDIKNDGTGDGMRIEQVGVLASNRHGLFVESTVGHTNADSALVRIRQGGASSEPALEVDAVSSGAGIEINKTGTGAGILLYSDTGHGMRIGAESSALATNRNCLYVTSNQANVNANSAVLKVNQGSGSATEPVLEVVNAGTGASIEIDQNGNGRSISIAHDGTAQAVRVDSTGTANIFHAQFTSALANNAHAIYVYTNTAQTNSSSLCKLDMNNASSTAPLLILDQGGTNAAHINFIGDPTNASPADGDLWYTGSALNFYDGSSTTDLLAGGGGAWEFVSHTAETAASGLGSTIAISDGSDYMLNVTFINDDSNSNRVTMRINNLSATYANQEQTWGSASVLDIMSNSMHTTAGGGFAGGVIYLYTSQTGGDADLFITSQVVCMNNSTQPDQNPVQAGMFKGATPTNFRFLNTSSRGFTYTCTLWKRKTAA